MLAPGASIPLHLRITCWSRIVARKAQIMLWLWARLQELTFIVVAIEPDPMTVRH